jgi:hypothetical protein
VGAWPLSTWPHDLKHDCPVALKVIHPELAATLGPEQGTQVGAEDLERDGPWPLGIPRVDIAIDVGETVHPDRVRAQMEGATIMGIGNALYGEITSK